MILRKDIQSCQTETLETARLILRKFNVNDAQDMFNGWCNDEEVTRYMTWNPHGDIKVTKAILSSWVKEYDDPSTVRYAICLKSNNKLIGSIDVVDYINGVPEIGYCLAKEYWNNGYMTEALKALVNHLFLSGFNKIVIEAEINNKGSNRVIEKSGFIFTHRETKDKWSIFKPYPVTVNWYEICK